MMSEPDLAVLVVPDHRWDQRLSWLISQSLFSKLKDPAGKRLPAGRFYQFRMAFDVFNTKGSFKVMGDEVARLLKAEVPSRSCLRPEPERKVLQKIL